MSAIEASLLDEAIREILAIQRRIAHKAKYVPDLQGSPSGLREDGRKSRMAMRSPHFNRVMTLPLRVNTSMFPNFAPEPMAPISEHQSQEIGSPLSDSETLVNWS